MSDRTELQVERKAYVAPELVVLQSAQTESKTGGVGEGTLGGLPTGS